MGDWISAIGMERCRSIFVHHNISGALLPELTSQQLKVRWHCVVAPSTKSVATSIKDGAARCSK